MRDSRSLRSEITYLTCLTRAVLDGIHPVLTTAVWTPVAVGAAIGVLSASLSWKRRSGYRAAVGGLVGSALGFGAGVAWSSRGQTGEVARSTLRKVNSVRDAHWLEKNPIAYA